MDIGKMVKWRRIELGLTLEQVGNLVGVSKSTVKKWEDGYISNMGRDKIALLAKALKISPVSLILGDEATQSSAILPPDNVVMRPVYNSVAAGSGVITQDVITEYMPAYISCKSEQDLYIWINVQGDSMSPLIDDGSKILVKKQESVDSGQIAVVLIDQEDAVVKRVIYSKTYIELQSVNPYYPPRKFEGEDMQRIQIIGLVKEVSKSLQ